MYHVQWRQTAVAQLAGAWREADGTARAAIAAAVRQIGVRLRDDPWGQGESRSEEERILLIAPLGVIFHVDVRERRAIILRAWVFGRKGRSGEGTG